MKQGGGHEEGKESAKGDLQKLVVQMIKTRYCRAAKEHGRRLEGSIDFGEYATDVSLSNALLDKNPEKVSVNTAVTGNTVEYTGNLAGENDAVLLSVSGEIPMEEVLEG